MPEIPKMTNITLSGAWIARPPDAPHLLDRFLVLSGPEGGIEFFHDPISGDVYRCVTGTAWYRLNSAPF